MFIPLYSKDENHCAITFVPFKLRIWNFDAARQKPIANLHRWTWVKESCSGHQKRAGWVLSKHSGSIVVELGLAITGESIPFRPGVKGALAGNTSIKNPMMRKLLGRIMVLPVILLLRLMRRKFLRTRLGRFSLNVKVIVVGWEYFF